MAKGPFILHGASKKIGNMVVYKNPNSNNADTTVAREYVAEVKNPKTRQQAIQRMRMLPAQQFYRAFRELLDHSWQGIKYGGRSYAHFMKAALADKTITIPYLLKGTTAFVPGAYPVSQGSLAEARVVKNFTIGDNIDTSVRLGSFTIGDTSTIGDFAQAIIDNNDGFMAGDFLTFLYCADSMGKFAVSYFRLVLDVESTTLLNTLPITLGKSTGHGTLTLINNTGRSTIGGASIIHSRKPAEGSTVWQRSNAVFALGKDAIADYTSTDAEEAAIASYQSNAGNVNAHWYLNGGAQ